MTVIMSTTNGKNDRIEFAATEKAKVWTSVRVRYLMVASTSPGRCETLREIVFGEPSSGFRTGGFEVAGTAKSNRTRTRPGRYKPKFRQRLRAYFFILVKIIGHDQRSYFVSLLISLAKRFNPAYYLLLNTGQRSGGETK